MASIVVCVLWGKGGFLLSICVLAHVRSMEDLVADKWALLASISTLSRGILKMNWLRIRVFPRVVLESVVAC